MTLNRVELIGRLGRDPEVRTTQGGTRVVNLRLATSERYKDRDGNRQEKTEWHSVVIWNEHIGKIAEQYCHKGDQIYLSGQLQTRKWSKDGVDQYTTEIVLQKFGGELKLLSGNGDGEKGQVQRGKSRSRNDDLDDSDLDPPTKTSGGRSQTSNWSDLDDDIPF